MSSELWRFGETCSKTPFVTQEKRGGGGKIERKGGKEGISRPIRGRRCDCGAGGGGGGRKVAVNFGRFGVTSPICSQPCFGGGKRERGITILHCHRRRPAAQVARDVFSPLSCILFSRSSCLLLLQRRTMMVETNSFFPPLESSWASIFHKRGAEEDHFAVCCNLTSRFISFPEGKLLFIGCFVSPPRPIRICSCCLGRR